MWQSLVVFGIVCVGIFFLWRVGLKRLIGWAIQGITTFIVLKIGQRAFLPDELTRDTILSFLGRGLIIFLVAVAIGGIARFIFNRWWVTPSVPTGV